MFNATQVAESVVQQSRPVVIRRDDIPAVTHVTIGDIRQFIGEVRDFRRNKSILDLMPNEGRPSLSWVHLCADQVHEVHKHPTVSMVVICDGDGELIGDVVEPVAAGDVVMIPPQAIHGFVGGKGGFWGLSVQFEGAGLYENPDLPRTELASDDKFRQMQEVQKSHLLQYGRNKLIELVTSDRIRTDESLKTNLLDVLQIWSDHFQKLIRIRAASTTNSHFSSLADDHLKDEFDHNKVLSDMRGNRPVEIWDPILESAAAWFSDKMAHGSDTDATIIMHLVIEGAGDEFHKLGAEVFPDSRHFECHAVHDEDHVSMGLGALRAHSTESLEHMLEVLDQGWAMMNLLCNRMAELAITRGAVGQCFNDMSDSIPSAMLDCVSIAPSEWW